MKKRIVSALLVCVLGMSLVTGCGNNAKAAETTKTADGKIQLDLWYSGGKTAVNVLRPLLPHPAIRKKSQSEFHLYQIKYL